MRPPNSIERGVVKSADKLSALQLIGVDNFSVPEAAREMSCVGLTLIGASGLSRRYSTKAKLASMLAA